MRLIGDVHGKIDQYIDIAEESPDGSIQLGDMALDYSKLDLTTNHCFFGGNHDNYDQYKNCPNALEHYGLYLGKFFYARGGFSIDRNTRIQSELIGHSKSWWDQEELNYRQMEECLEYYIQVKPDIVLSHSAPQSIVSSISSPGILVQYGFDPTTFVTNTQLLLQAMLDAHRPKFWYFGHFHRSWQKTILGTHFQCLDELEYVDV